MTDINKEATIDLWQMGKEFSKFGAERLANFLISAGERSDSIRRILFIWSAFIKFEKDQNWEGLESMLVLAITINDFKSDDESSSYDLVIYELQDFLNEKFEIPELKKNVKGLLERLKPVMENSMEHLSEDWIWAEALEEMTNTFNQV